MVGQAVSHVKWLHEPVGGPEVGGTTPGGLFSALDPAESPGACSEGQVAGLHKLALSPASSEMAKNLMSALYGPKILTSHATTPHH